MMTRSHEHGRPPETKPDSTIHKHLCKTIEANKNSGQRLNFNQALKLTMPPVGSVGTTVLAAEFEFSWTWTFAEAATAVAELVLSKDILKYPKLYSTWTAPKSCAPPKCSYLNILWLLFGKNYRFFFLKRQKIKQFVHKRQKNLQKPMAQFMHPVKNMRCNLPLHAG